MTRPIPRRTAGLASLVAAAAVALGLAAFGTPTPAPGLYQNDVAAVQRTGGDCYRFEYRTVDRRECVFVVAVSTRDYEAVGLPELEARLWNEAGPALRTLGFDTLQVIPLWPRELLTARFDRADIHLASAPAASVVDATEDLPSILDWPYDPIAVYGTYRAVVLTRVDRPLRSLADLNDQPVAAVGESSSSGYRVPRHYLKGQGVFPAWRFAQGSHADVVDAVLAGDVRAGVTHNEWDRYLTPEEIAQLVQTEIEFDIPGATWVLRRDVAAHPAVSGRLYKAAYEWGLQVNDPGGYWAELVAAPPNLIRTYDEFRAAERTLQAAPPPSRP